MEELNSQENGDKTTLLNADRGFKVKSLSWLGKKRKKKKAQRPILHTRSELQQILPCDVLAHTF